MWVKRENLSGELGTIVKMAAEMEGYLDGPRDEDFKVKSFFEHEICSHNCFANSERHISEVLTLETVYQGCRRLQLSLVN